jgi:hypothetical protein
MRRNYLDPRRAQERADGHMIREDHTATANLSPIPIVKEYPDYLMSANILFDEVVYRPNHEQKEIL